MEILVTVLMIMVCFNFVLKQTFQNVPYLALSTVVCSLFVGAAWPYAIEQSKTQIGEWITNQSLMLDMSVLLSIEVLVQLAFCAMAVHVATSNQLKRRTIVVYKILRFFPGLLIFPVLFGGLVQLIFNMPGESFSVIAWSFAASVLVGVPVLSIGLKHVFGEKELRLELLFLSNTMLAILGIVATVNGRTAVDGTATIDWTSLAGFIILIVIFGLLGMASHRYKLKQQIHKK